jgi:uncharacterized repeat protein (TIGR03803 family)
MTGTFVRACLRAVLFCYLAGPALAQQPTVLYTFPSYGGGYFPRGGLAMDNTGALLGTTYYGGLFQGSLCANCGTIFKLTPSGGGAWSYQLLHTFTPAPIQGANEDGIDPVSPLVNFNNVFYGTTNGGGDTQCGCGIVFSITPDGTYKILHIFDPFVPGGGPNQWPLGTTPVGGLLIGADGTIYGTTSAGGTGQGRNGSQGAGIIFRMNTDGGGFTKLHDFDGALNGGPQGMMIFGQDGAIYGTQYGGGQFNQGVIFRMDTSGNYQVIYDFKGINQPGNSTDGANPNGRLALGPDGTIYGTTEFGGSPSSFGTAWSIQQVNGSWVYKQLFRFGFNKAGNTPNSGLIFGRDGALYGTTSGGGQFGGGVIYRLVPTVASGQYTWTYQTLFDFQPLSATGDTPTADLLYANGNLYGANLSGGDVAHCPSAPGGCGNVFQFTPQPATALVAAVLPSSRSVQVGNTATAFATILNSGAAATSCGIAPATPVPATFSFQTTDPATNKLSGSPNTPVAIGAGKAQTYLVAFAATSPLAPTNVVLGFGCATGGAVAPIVGVNTLLMTFGATPVPDMIAVGLTPSNDGYAHTGGPSGTGLFVIASTNIGTSAALTARVRVSDPTLPLSPVLCQTNPSNGQCLSPPAKTVTATVNNNQNTTWSAFLPASGAIPQDPAANRVFFEFLDSNGVVRGSTSTAVTSQ